MGITKFEFQTWAVFGGLQGNYALQSWNYFFKNKSKFGFISYQTNNVSFLYSYIYCVFFLMVEDINNFTLFRLPRQQGKYWSSVQILDLLKKNYFVVVTL